MFANTVQLQRLVLIGIYFGCLNFSIVYSVRQLLDSKLIIEVFRIKYFFGFPLAFFAFTI